MATDASPPTDPTAALGERILAELGDPRTNDTLTRWLAHHTARLINTAEQAAARQDPDADNRAAEARAAILDLWEHRSAWPRGWPPDRAAALVRLLNDLPEIDDPGWGNRSALGRLQLLHHHLLAALTDLAVAGGDPVEEGWLNAFGHLLTPDEAALLTRAASAPRRLVMLLDDDRTTVRPRPLQAFDGDDAAINSLESDNTTSHGITAHDETAGAPANAVLEIADAYREAVADLFRRVAGGD
jgi:hypothetical protein